MSMVVHRLKHLFLEVSGLSSHAIDLLFGPLINWCYGTIKLNEAAMNTAKEIGGKCIVKVSIAYRMCYLYEIMMATKDKVPKEANYPYIIGIVMDTHIPSLQADVESLVEIYNSELAPEMIKIDRVYNDEVPLLSETFLSQLWRDDEINIRSSVKPPSKQTVTVRKKKRRKLYKDFVPNCLLDEYKPIKKQAESIDVSLKSLFEKGMHGVTTTRGMTDLFSECRKSELGYKLVRMFELGAYRHATFIAPPLMRIKPLENTYKPADITNILGECIYATTIHYVALYQGLYNNPSVHAYYQHIINVVNLQLRPRLYESVITPVPKHVYQHTMADTMRVFHLLAKKIAIRSRINKALLKHIDVPMDYLFCRLAEHPNRLRINGRVLQSIGMSDRDLKILSDLNTRADERISHVVTSVIRRLSAKGYALLHVCVHYLLHRSQLGVRPILAKRKFVSVKGSNPYLHICKKCHTIRSQCRMVVVSEKSPKRLATDITSSKGVLVCTDCYSTDILSVDMRYNYVFGPTPSNMTRRCVFCMCHHCGVITERRYVIGDAEYCRVCYHELASKYTVQKCLCGHTVDQKKEFSYLLAERDGRVTMQGLCHRHIFLRRQCHPCDIQPISFYQTFIE